MNNDELMTTKELESVAKQIEHYRGTIGDIKRKIELLFEPYSAYNVDVSDYFEVDDYKGDKLDDFLDAFIHIGEFDDEPFVVRIYGIETRNEGVYYITEVALL